MRLRWLNAAREELFEHVKWYERQRPGLGGEFLDELDSVIERARNNPQEFPRWEFVTKQHDVRRARLGRFPHQLLFVILGTDVWVTAVAHPSRTPRYWVKRLRQIRPIQDSE